MSVRLNGRAAGKEAKRVRIGFDAVVAKPCSFQSGRNRIWVYRRYGVPDVNQSHPQGVEVHAVDGYENASWL